MPKGQSNIEESFKLPREHRYFNISVLWIFYYTGVIKLLYRTRIRHEAVTILSLGCGILGGLFLLRPGYGNLLLAALLFHFKDIFDASDGSLARLQKKTNRIARFLDSLCDMTAMTWLILALGMRSYSIMGYGVVGLCIITWFSMFIQCSYFNYYLVCYTELFGKTNVRTDERIMEGDRKLYNDLPRRVLLLLLQRAYGAAYGWQDRLIAAWDLWSRRRTLGSYGDSEDTAREGWYGDKAMMTLSSPLCFGTHIFLFILMAVLSRPEFFYYIVIFPLNGLLILNALYREKRIRRMRSERVRCWGGEL